MACESIGFLWEKCLLGFTPHWQSRVLSLGYKYAQRGPGQKVVRMVEERVQYGVLPSNVGFVHHFLTVCCVLGGSIASTAQQAQLPDAAQPPPQDPGSAAKRSSSRSENGKNHILWVIPNYRSNETIADIKPLTPRQTFKL